MDFLKNSSSEENGRGPVGENETENQGNESTIKYSEYLKVVNILEGEMKGIKGFIEILPVGIMIVDEDKNIVHINRSLEKKIKKSKRKVIGKKGGEGLGCYNSQNNPCGEGRLCETCPLKNTVESVLKTGVPIYDMEVNPRFIIDDVVTSFWLRITVSSIIIENKKYAFIIMEDIDNEKRNIQLENEVTESEKKLIELMRYDHKRNEFFANVTHEFKTPLNIILSTIQLLNDMNTENKAFLKYNNIMRQNCYRLLKLINNLIDIARIESGFFDINLKNQNIVAIVEDTTLSTVEYARMKGIKLVFDTDIEERIIACDAEKIERIILNLLSNAIKYTKDNGNIHVHLYEKDHRLILSVKDSGIGIPPEMASEIFKIFRQVDTSFRRNNEGSGIGLFIVKTIVKLHGGNLKVKSQVNQGSEFIIEFPIRVICTEEETYEAYSTYEHNKEKSTIEFSNIK